MKSLPFGVLMLLSLLISAAVSFGITPIVKRMAYKVGAVDVPKEARRMHSVPIPRLGGLAIAIAFLLTVLLFAKVDEQMRGILLGGVPGVERANVVIIGGGNGGTNAAKMAVGLGANVTILDLNAKRLAYLDDIFGGRVQTLLSNSYNIARAVREADLVVGCVLIPGAKAPKLVTEEMVKTMRPGSVLVDVAIDQGGSIATIDRITTHQDPFFVKHGVLHYSVANMPGAVPRTSTLALTGATLPYALRIAKLGAEAACKADPALMKGLNTYKGHLTCRAVAEAQNLTYTDPTTLL